MLTDFDRRLLTRARNMLDNVLAPEPDKIVGVVEEVSDIHIVQYGESLWSIASSYELDWTDLLVWNHMDKDGLIYPGMQIQIADPAVNDNGAVEWNPQWDWNSPVDPGCADLEPPGWYSAIGHGEIYAYPADYKGQTHTGNDLNRLDRRDYRLPVCAVGDGEVICSINVPSWGNVIVIDHGNVASRYAHLYKRAVEVGATVFRGDRIGLLGDSGGQMDPHLHFDIAESSLFHAKPLHWAGATLDLFSKYHDPKVMIRRN